MLDSLFGRTCRHASDLLFDNLVNSNLTTLMSVLKTFSIVVPHRRYFARLYERAYVLNTGMYIEDYVFEKRRQMMGEEEDATHTHSRRYSFEEKRRKNTHQSRSRFF